MSSNIRVVKNGGGLAIGRFNLNQIGVNAGDSVAFFLTKTSIVIKKLESD